MLLFLTTNMAAVTSRANQQLDTTARHDLLRIREAQYGQSISLIHQQINNFARASYCFVNISLPSPHDHDVKMPNFTFY